MLVIPEFRLFASLGRNDGGGKIVIHAKALIASQQAALILSLSKDGA